MNIEGIGSTKEKRRSIIIRNQKIPKKWQIIWYFVTLTHLLEKGRDIEGFGAQPSGSSSEIFYSYPSMIERDFDRLDEQQRIVDRLNCFKKILNRLIDSDDINTAFDGDEPCAEYIDQFFESFNSHLIEKKIFRVIRGVDDSLGKDSHNDESEIIKKMLLSKKDEYLREIENEIQKYRRTKKILTKATAVRYCEELEMDGLLLSHGFKAPRQGSKNPHYYYNNTFDGFKKLLDLMFTILPEKDQVMYLHSDYMKEKINSEYIHHVLSKKNCNITCMVPIYAMDPVEGKKSYTTEFSQRDDELTENHGQEQVTYDEYINQFERWMEEKNEGRFPGPFFIIKYPFYRLRKQEYLPEGIIQEIIENNGPVTRKILIKYPSLIKAHYSNDGYEYWRVIFPLILLFRISSIAVKYFFLEKWEEENLINEMVFVESNIYAGKLMSNLVGKVIQQITSDSFYLPRNCDINSVSINPIFNEKISRKPGTLEIESTNGITLVYDIHKMYSQKMICPYSVITVRSYPPIWKIVNEQKKRLGYSIGMKTGYSE